MEIMATGTVRSMVPELMRERGMTIAELARASGLAYNTASAWSRGYVDRIDKTTLAALCDAFRVQPGDILVYVPDVSSVD